jgi:shikimate kinase
MRLARLFLIGPRGSGKSTVARLLAERLGWEAVDADAELERRCGRSIRTVFAEEGEEGFRRHEADLLAELCRRERVVIATGGGVVLREENRDRLRLAGKVAWLTADLDTLWQRISQDPSSGERRPRLSPGAADGRAELEELVRAREPLYRACADCVVDTTGRTPEEVAGLVLEQLAESGDFEK